MATAVGETGFPAILGFGCVCRMVDDNLFPDQHATAQLSDHHKSCQICINQFLVQPMKAD